jgi:type I restriction enzyme S subunit
MTKLGKYIKIIGGGTPSKAIESYWGGDIPWMSVKDLKSDNIYSTVDSITREGVANSATNIVPSGSLIISTRMAVGKPAITHISTAINQDLKAIEVSKELNKKFLFYLFKKSQKYFERISTGATVKGIKLGSITDLEVDLPPLEDQKRIAAILDAADEVRQKNKALIEKYNQLTQSLFLDMFGDPVTNPKGWEKVSLKELCDFTRKSIKPEDINDGDYYIGLESIQKKTGRIIEKVEVEKGELKSNKFWFDPNYILYGKLRPYLNKVAKPHFEGICSTDIIPIKPIKEKSAKEFIVSLMRGSWFVAFADERSSGANLPRISPKEVEKYHTISPPLKIQNQFAERVQAIETQKSQAEDSLKKSEDLFNALLQRAFKGEL